MDLPSDVLEVLDAIDENQQELSKIIGKHLKIKEFNDFGQKCEELCGVDVNPILEYFINKHSTSRDKFALTFQEFIDVAQKWADNSMKNKLNDNQEDEVELENLDDEKEQLQIQSRDNIVLKFDRHHEKLYEIFQNYAEQVPKPKPKTPKDSLITSKNNDKDPKLSTKNSNQKFNEKAAVSSKPLASLNKDDDEDAKDDPQVKLKKLDKIFDDIAYLTSTCLVSFSEFSEGSIIKKSSPEAKEQIMHYIWKRLHDDELLELRKTRKTTSIFKQSATANYFKSDKGSKKQQLTTQKTDKSNNKSIKEESNSINNEEKQKITESTGDLKAQNDQFQQKNDDKNKNLPKPSQQRRTRKVKKTVKKKVPKQNAEDNKQGAEQEFEEIEVETEVEETDPEDEIDADFYKDKSIVFEDEKFQEERGETLLPFSLFQPYLEDFISEHNEYVVVDSNDELREYRENQEQENPYLNVAESGEDPLKRNLTDTINMYEQMLEADNFKDKDEKAAAINIVNTLK